MKEKTKLSPFHKYIWSIIKRNYMLSEGNILTKYPSFNPKVVKGVLKHLKQEKWIVYLPSLDMYMTTKDYKERINDGLADTFSDDASE